jgi:coenzyme F420 hydrogenase subunit delta
MTAISVFPLLQKLMPPESGSEHDILPAFCRARLLILGVGNVLFGDDAFGPEVTHYLLAHYQIPEDVYVMDVGTGVRKILFTLTLSEKRPEEILIVDAVDWGGEVGRVSEISADQLPLNKVDDFSLHQLPTSNLLRDLQEQGNITVTVISCDVEVIPEWIRPGLTPAVQQAVIEAGRRIAARYGFRPLADLSSS